MGPEYFLMGGMWLFPLLGLLVMISIIYLAFGRRHCSKNNDDSALEILKKRYAKGDISKEEFHQMKKELE
jgi:putative membrane protein